MFPNRWKHELFGKGDKEAALAVLVCRLPRLEFWIFDHSAYGLCMDVVSLLVNGTHAALRYLRVFWKAFDQWVEPKSYFRFAVLLRLPSLV